MLALPVDALFAGGPNDICRLSRSCDIALLKLPAPPCTVIAILIVAVLEKAIMPKMELDDAQRLASHDVAPILTAPLDAAIPNPLPVRVMLALPVDALLLTNTVEAAAASNDPASVALAVKAPTVSANLMLMPATCDVIHRTLL
mmetsp:Transcript_58448/g.119533  ORF Transcript_58448/g.119533 Transcript_58448/m.119533 type:complete len:144 (-) Transcript_58448:1051-1482(-)